MCRRNSSGTAAAGAGVIDQRCGAALSLWASRFVSTLLYGLEPRDASTLAMAAGPPLTIGALAGWAPARRAATLDLARVLRDEA
jgi:ABC-type lipoprotein release transport system permease subunit